MTDFSATSHFRTAATPNGWHQDPGHAHIARGMEIEPDEGWHPEAAHRILSGTATHDDVLHHVDTDRVGHYWSTHNASDASSLDTPKSYAEPHEPIANWTRHTEPGENVLGAAGVVLVGHRPHGWNPDDNPDGGLMGNSYVPDHSRIPLHEIHYTGDGETWHTLTPPAGATVHTDGPARTATAFFRAPYDASEGGDHGQRAEHAGTDRPGGRGGDPAPRGDGRRPQPGQPERTEAPGRRVRAAAAVERHPELQGDLDRLGGGARHVQDTIDALQHDRGGVTAYPLSHPLEGWHAAITGGGHQVVHRTDPDTKTLHVGYAGHNVGDAEERLGASTEHSSLPVEFHKGAEKDFDNLHPEVQEKALNTIDRLSRGEPHRYDHSLTGMHWERGGWRSARADFLHRVTHRFEDNEGNPTSPERAARLFVGHIGPHNYEAAAKRLSSLTDFFREATLQETASMDDEHLDLYHRTTPEAAAAIYRDKRMHSRENLGGRKPVYFSTFRGDEKDAQGSGYGEGVVHVRVPHHIAEIDDEFPSGEQHYNIDAKDLRPEHFVDQPTHRTAGIDNEGHQVERDPIDGWQHADGSVSHDDGTTISDHPIRMTPAEEQLLQREAAAVDNDDGVMVAIVPPREIAEQLAREGGQPVEDLHITLAYLGKMADYTPEQLKLLPQIVGSWAVRQKPVSVRIGGVGKFNNSHKGQHVLITTADIPGGAQMHSSLAFVLEGHGFKLPSEHGWLPHLTLAYVNEHFRFMPHIDEHRWQAEEAVTVIGGVRHPARFGGRPSTPTTL
jgi:2'-5' RNA ligase